MRTGCSGVTALVAPQNPRIISMVFFALLNVKFWPVEVVPWKNLAGDVCMTMLLMLFVGW